MKDPMIGQQLANFRVERLLGQGGMATVYYGRDVSLQRAVAIKVIDKRYRSDPAYTTRFLNEARMMAKWRHENLIQIYYAGEQQGYSYYVMEYIDGEDLSMVMAAYAEENALMPNKDVLRIGNAIARALDYAHAQGIIHRDVKPSNVMIAKDGRVLLGDFGMALEVSDGSMGNIFGTPHYISPEQAKRSADAVPQSDLYSLGIILYEALSGAVPFDDSSPASIALLHITQAPPRPRSINPQISAAVETVILKALDKKPQNRYQSGAQLMSALQEAFKASAPKMSLPPLPVGAPTIVQGKQPADPMPTRLVTDKKENLKPAPAKNKKNKWVIILLLLLLLLGTGGWFCAKSGLFPMAVAAAPTFSPSPAESTLQPVQPTQTLIPPSATSTANPPTFTATAAATRTATATITATATATATTQPSATATIQPPKPNPTTEMIGVPTVKYPNGNNLTLFWNETSFVMLNRSRASRSLSGFTFERLDLNDQPAETLPGFRLENHRFKYIPGKNCISVKSYKDQTPPYLDPMDCAGSYSSIIQPDKIVEPEIFFWDIKEGSTQFRVLWVGEEIARCEIGAGACEIYIP